MLALLFLLHMIHAEESCENALLGSLTKVRDEGVKRACTLNSTYLQNAQAHRQDFIETFKSGVTRGRRVILLGVEHFNFEGELYPKFVAKAREANPQLNCYFVEEELNPKSKDARRALEKFNAGDSSSWTPEIMNFDEDTLKMWTKIRDLGLKIHFVDHPDGLSEAKAKDPANVDRWARDRNTAMSKNIERLMKRGGCRAAFYPVGAFHLSDQNGETVPRQLARRGIQSDRMMLIVAGRNSRDEGSPENGSWHWRKNGASICPSDLPVPKHSFGFVNGKESVPVYYDGRFFLDYRDFSRTLVHVCETEACAKYNSGK